MRTQFRTQGDGAGDGGEEATAAVHGVSSWAKIGEDTGVGKGERRGYEAGGHEDPRAKTMR
jgi:hypothetical protein